MKIDVAKTIGALKERGRFVAPASRRQFLVRAKLKIAGETPAPEQTALYSLEFIAANFCNITFIWH
jgi:hypothetical protein